jgi:osmotically-inducible protein OsmY
MRVNTLKCPFASAFFCAPTAECGVEMKTDAQLKNEVMEELLWDTSIKSRDISVRASDGVITLSGTVSSYAEKSAAELAVQRVSGVKAIAEQLQVYLTGSEEKSDSQIAEMVVSTLGWNVWVPKHILATVENGWVTLTGLATWEYERSSAENAIKYLTGVKGVSNKIVVKPEIIPSEVKHLIEEALKRNARFDAQLITVTTEEGMVTLSGNVRTWEDRREVATAAWHAPGVTNVENLITVS